MSEKKNKIFFHRATWTETSTYHEDQILVDKEIYQSLVEALKEAYEQNAMQFNEKDGITIGSYTFSGPYIKVKPLERGKESGE